MVVVQAMKPLQKSQRHARLRSRSCSRRDEARGKPSLSQVRLEPFRGSRTQYQTWKRTLEAQRSLYQLNDPEVSMLVYLSTHGEARAILDQLEIAEMREEGGLQRMMRLLEESFGALVRP